jgi:hypothetical protein
MNDKRALPVILRHRAERILKKPLKVVYRANEDNPFLLEVIMLDGSSKYVDLKQGKEVSAVSPSQQVEVKKQEEDTQPARMITRDMVEGKEKPKKRTKKDSTAVKNTVTKKLTKKKSK